MRVEINKTVYRKIIESSNPKVLSLKRATKLINLKLHSSRKNTQITIFKNQRGNITADFTEIKKS